MPTTTQLIDHAHQLIATSYEYTAEEFDEALAAFIDASGNKLAALRAVAKASEAVAGVHATEAKAHAVRVKAEEAKAARCKDLAYMLLCAMREAGEEPNVKGIARIQSNGGKAPIRYAVDFAVASLPAEYQRVTVDVDSEALRAALEAGKAFPGVELGERGEGVRWG